MKARDILAQALTRTDPAERAAFLDRACAGDEDLRRQVEALLQAESPPEAAAPVTQTLVYATAAVMSRSTAEGPGSVIGPYKLLTLLGSGGMGMVYMAEQQRPIRRKVAIKIIRHGMDSDLVIARFEAERQALAMMDHPGIAKVLDAGTTESGRPYFVMELVEGAPITEYCDDRQLTPRDRLQLFIPVCQAIQHAHQKGIIHRDIKPSNILVAEYDGKPVGKVIDFGVAKAIGQSLTEHPKLTQIGTIVGTLEYMSPEQAETAGIDVDTRTDIYSLGAVFYELLTGTTPLETGRRTKAAYAEILKSIREQEPPRPSARLTASRDTLTTVAAQRSVEPAGLLKTIRGELDWIVMKALEKDRTRRYETANGLLRDLQRYLNAEPVEASPPSATYRARKFAFKHRWLLAAAAAFLALLVTGVVISVGQAVRATRAEGLAIRERDRALAAERQANAQRMVAYATESLSEDPERSIILAMHAVNATLQFDRSVLHAALNALHAAILGSRSRLTLAGHDNIVNKVAFSRDGRRIATAAGTTAKLWDANTGQELLTLRGHQDWVRSVAFSPDGNRLATAGMDKALQLWDVETGRHLLTLLGHQGSVNDVAFSPDGKRLATASGDRTAKIWDAATGRELLTARVHQAALLSVAWSADGKRIATAADDNTARLLDVFSGRSLVTVQHRSIRSAALTPDGKRIATAGAAFRNAVRLWDAATGRELPLSSHQDSVWAVTFSPDGRRLATASSDKSSKLWDAATGQELLTLRGHSDSVLSVAFSPDGNRVATAGRDRTVKLWDIAAGQELLTFQGSRFSAKIAFSPDGKRLAATDVVIDQAARSMRDPSMTLWDSFTGKELVRLRGYRNIIWDFAFSPDGKMLASGGFEDGIKIMDAATGRELLALPGAIPPIAFTPDGSRLASGARDLTAKLWDVSTGKELLASARHPGRVIVLAFSADGKRLATSSPDDGTVKSWDAATGRELLTWRITQKFRGMDFSPDGQRLVTSNPENHAFTLWDAETGEESTTLRGHQAAGTGAAFSGDGKRLATSSDDRTVKLWDAATGEELLTLRGHQSSVLHVAFSPDGKRLATMDREGVVQVYALDIQDLLALARKRVTRALTIDECRRYFQSETCPELP